MTITLNKVQYLPKDLEPEILYVSVEFKVAGHLCPCGCGNKIITPLGPNEWSFTETDGKATLYPSIGNWQLPCRSHYWIYHGMIEWSYPWSDRQIKAGAKYEQKKIAAYYRQRARKRTKQSLYAKMFGWLTKNKSQY